MKQLPSELAQQLAAYLEYDDTIIYIEYPDETIKIDRDALAKAIQSFWDSLP